MPPKQRGPGPAPMPARKYSGSPPKLTKAAKSRALVSQLDLARTSPLLFDSAQVTIRQPYVANQLALNFIMPDFLFASEDWVYFAGYDPANVVLSVPLISIFIKIARPNTPHLLTIYIDSDEDQKYFLTNNKGGDSRLSQDFMVNSGASAILFAFVPTTSGSAGFTFSAVSQNGNNTTGYYLSRVEVDVVN